MRFAVEEKIVPKMLCDNDWLRLTGDDRYGTKSCRWSVAMRRLLLAAVIFGAAQGAYAADMPDLPVLRGSLPEGLSTVRTVWQGYYIGGQASYGSVTSKPSPSLNSDLQNTVVP